MASQNPQPSSVKIGFYTMQADGSRRAGIRAPYHPAAAAQPVPPSTEPEANAGMLDEVRRLLASLTPEQRMRLLTEALDETNR